MIATSAFATTLLLALPYAQGAQKGGVTMQDHITVSGKTLSLNGMGIREATWMNIDVYVAGLYLERTSSNPVTILGFPQTMRLQMQFVRGVSKSDLTDALHKGVEKNVGADARPRLKDRIARLTSWMSKIEKGQTMTFTWIPGKGTEVVVNGAVKGTIEGDDFGRALFSVWIGPNPPNNGLKKGLLGK